MAAIPCRLNDGGLCHDPNQARSTPTVLVTEGNISLLSQPMVNRIFPEGLQLEPSDSRALLEVPDERFVADMIDSVLLPEVSQLQIAVMDAIGQDDGVIVSCSCGHRWVYRIVGPND
jgi:hypothetical protein